MMKPHRPLVVVLAFFLASCSLDIPRPAEKPDPIKPEYDVSSLGGTEVRHYDGNDTLMWINRFELGAAGQQLKKYHYSAQDVLLWYEYRQFENLGNHWRKTGEQHFTPPKDAGLLVWSHGWAYDSVGDEVLYTDFDAANALQGYSHSWYEDLGASRRILQAAHYDASGASTWFQRWRYDPTEPGRKTTWASLDGNRTVSQMRTSAFDGAGNVTEVVEYAAWNDKIVRTTSDRIPVTQYHYRTSWYSAPAIDPASPDFESAASSPLPPFSSGIYSQPANWSFPAGLAPVTALQTLPERQLVAFPQLDLPGSEDWDLDGFEFFLPGREGGRTVLRFDGRQKPMSLVREALGTLEDIRVDFAWNLQDQLTRRVVSYAGSPVLTVDFSRDEQGRVTRIETSGPAMRLPLTSILEYPNASAQRPQALLLTTVVKNVEVDLLTLLFTYDDDHTGAGRFGLGALSFDDHLQSIVAGAGAGDDLVRLVELVFLAPVTSDGVTTKTVELWDVLGKTDETKELTGRLLWTLDTDGHQTGLVWQVAQGSDFTDKWSYESSWGKWASHAQGWEGLTLDAQSEVETKASEAMSLADSFDFEKVFQLVTPLTKILKDGQAQFQRSAGSLFDQVEASANELH